jgi:phage terminase large subunit-like protein
MTPIKKTVDEWLNEISYDEDPNYVPSEFALEFVSFIKLVNGEKGEENKSPVIHYRMLDNIAGKKENTANMCSRGMAKTTIMAEYLFLYIAVYGAIPGFGEVDYALYVSDSIENGVKKMRLRLERRCENSPFLRKYIPTTRFTDIRWYFKSAEGKEFVVTGHGAKTGVRGTVELNTRPQVAVLDDLMSDDDARSPTIIENVENTVYSAIDYALHPNKRKVIWSGTPFNAKDPLYKAIESGVWHVNVYPVCETFPCSREDFKGAWEDRFDYDYVKNQYEKAKGAGKLDSFNQELMLRIMSEEERLIEDSDITWYKRRTVTNNKGAYNFYITTDFATSDKQHADFSVINVWAFNNNGDWLWIDGFCKRALMDESIDNLFRLVQEYSPQEVGIEVTGQQGGFISWIQNEMGNRNVYFTLSKGKGRNTLGIRPTKDKMSRFQQNAVPLFKSKKIWLPEELRDSHELAELLSELALATLKGFKSKHDDQIDTISMLGELNAWKPSEVSTYDEEDESKGGSLIWDDDTTNQTDDNSYYV